MKIARVLWGTLLGQSLRDAARRCPGVASSNESTTECSLVLCCEQNTVFLEVYIFIFVEQSVKLRKQVQGMSEWLCECSTVDQSQPIIPQEHFCLLK